jgi:hypothetical protein
MKCVKDFAANCVLLTIEGIKGVRSEKLRKKAELR